MCVSRLSHEGNFKFKCTHGARTNYGAYTWKNDAVETNSLHREVALAVRFGTHKNYCASEQTERGSHVFFVNLSSAPNRVTEQFHHRSIPQENH